jgi:hypothetical protein
MTISSTSSIGVKPSIEMPVSAAEGVMPDNAVSKLPGTKPDGFAKAFHFNEVGAEPIKKPGLFGKLRNVVGGGINNVKKGSGWLWNKTLGGLGNTLNDRAQNHFLKTGKMPFLNPLYKPTEAAQQLRWFNTQGVQHLNKAATIGSGAAGAAVGWNVGPVIGERFFGQADAGKWRLFGAAGGAAGGVGVKQGVQHLWGNEIATFVRNVGSRLILRR